MSFWKKPSDSKSSRPEGENEEFHSGVPTVTTGISSPKTPVVGKSGEGISSSKSSSSSPVAPTVATATPHLAGSNLTRPEEVLTERFGKARSALGEGTIIQGKLSFDTPVRIDGKLSGEIFSSKVLIVGPAGLIDAKIEVAALIVLGSVKGDITATERVEIWTGATVEGKVRTSNLVIQEGSHFSGTSEMLSMVAKYSNTAEGTKNSARSSEKSESGRSEVTGKTGSAHP